MTGAAFKVGLDWNDGELRRVFNQLETVGTDMTPLMAEASSIMLLGVQDHFMTETAPDGSPWAPLSPKTLMQKKAPYILRERGDLYQSLEQDFTSEYAMVFTPMIYAATHQFGRDNIPARPYMGMSDAMADEILDASVEFLAGALK